MDGDAHKKKLLSEIKRLQDDFRLLEQEEQTRTHSIRIAEAKARLRALIRKLEAYERG